MKISLLLLMRFFVFDVFCIGDMAYDYFNDILEVLHSKLSFSSLVFSACFALFMYSVNSLLGLYDWKFVYWFEQIQTI